jgi:hypothetical protein
MIVIVLFHVRTASAINSESAHEILSVKIGEGTDNIRNQFVGAEPFTFDGFIVDIKGNIYISDTLNHRVMRFRKERGLPTFFTVNDTSSFYPESLCLTEDGVVYVHNSGKQEMIAFSPDGKVLKFYNPASVSEYKDKKHYILSLTCNTMTVRVLFFINDPKINSPTYQDEYDHNFKLISRKVFYGDRSSYYEAIEKSIHGFEKHFEDSRGNKYGYPLEKNWDGKFLPLQKYSDKGTLLKTIDGALLTRHTKYNVYDYYTMKIGLPDMKGKDFIIANWHVTPSGGIYALIANTEYVKVLKIEETPEINN